MRTASLRSVGTLTALALLSLTACGGGGGGGGGTAPVAPTLNWSATNIKTFRFVWTDVSGETEYRLLEDPNGASGYAQVATLAADSTSHSLEVALHNRVNARYILQACNASGCADSAPVAVSGNLANAIGYFKASNTDAGDLFGGAIALSATGDTLAIGAASEDSNATGVGGNQSDDSASASGAVYVFARTGGVWTQQAYIKASNTEPADGFGERLALSADGNTLAVSAPTEDSNATGVGGDDSNNSASDSGAVYIYTRNGTNWTDQAYVKASNTAAGDRFGFDLSLSADGNTLAVGAPTEDSDAAGINGDESNDSAPDSGAVYLFARSGTNWSQQAYVKASNTEAGDAFGNTVALSGDGNTLAIAAWAEDSNAIGVNGTQLDNLAPQSGAVYVFARSGSSWSQQAYVKASNTGVGDRFGSDLSLSADGGTLVVGAVFEDSDASGINGNQFSDAATDSGAAYLFTRSGANWMQQAYVKPSNTGMGDVFGASVALSDDGNRLAVSAPSEDSSALGLNGNQTDNASADSGAAYVFVRAGAVWAQQAYVKASNTEADDNFVSLALSGDGDTLAVGATLEDSIATGIGGNPSSNSALSSGAVYLY